MDARIVARTMAGIALGMCTAAAVQAQVYWRLDAGASVTGMANFKDKDFVTDGLICGDGTCSSPGSVDSLGTSPMFAAGVGWRFSPNLRADTTLEYRGGYKIDKTMPDDTHLKADVSSLSFMVNGYYDFTASFGRPYVGVGLGLSRNRLSGFTATNPGAPGLTAGFLGATRTDVALAVMAGIAIPVSAGMELDLAARFTDLGRIESGAGQVTVNGNPLPGGTYSGAQGRIRAVEFTAGLRF